MRRALIDRLLLALALAAGAAVRFIPPWSDVFSGPGAVFLTPDPYYHLRRIQYAVAHFPKILEFDPFVNFPAGAKIIWPPGFDLLLATVAKLLAPGGDPDAVERVCALAIPFLGLAAIYAVYLLGRRSLPSPGGGAAALTFALLPIPVQYSQLGYVDHHVLEPFFMAAAAALMVGAWGRAGRGAALLGAWAGVVAALACAFAPQGIVTVALLCALATLEGVLGRFPGSRPAGLGAVIAATLTLAALAAATPWGRTGEMTYLALSPFQAHLAVAAGGMGCALMILRWPELRRSRRLAGFAAGLAVGVGALLRAGPALLEPMREAAAFMSGSEALISTVFESMPLWSRPPSYLLQWLTPLGLAAPALLLAALWRERRGAAGCVALLALVVYATGFLQLRFMGVGGIAIAWAAGWGAGRIWATPAGIPRRSFWRTAATTALFLSVAGVYTFPEVRAHARVPDSDVRALWRELERRGDSGEGLLRTDGPPRWGVIAPWEIGHFLLYEAGAPVVACPFGQAPWHIEGIRRGLRFLLTDTDAAASSTCRELRVRQVVTTDPFRTISEAAMMGLPLERYARSIDRAGGAIDMTAHYWSSTSMRLHLFDGSSRVRPDLRIGSLLDALKMSRPGGHALRIPAMPSFRIVWESEGRLSNIPARYLGDADQPAVYKLFEVVKGARIEGRCRPGEFVMISVPVELNTGRRLDWVDAIRCRAEGSYRLRIPHPFPAARLTQGDVERLVEVSEAAVEAGDTLTADVLP